jgi:hypothetical protein
MVMRDIERHGCAVLPFLAWSYFTYGIRATESCCSGILCYTLSELGVYCLSGRLASFHRAFH